MQNALAFVLLICGAALAMCGAFLICELPPVPVATFPHGFTAEHFNATAWLFIGAFGMLAGSIAVR